MYCASGCNRRRGGRSGASISRPRLGRSSNVWCTETHQAPISDPLSGDKCEPGRQHRVDRLARCVDFQIGGPSRILANGSEDPPGFDSQSAAQYRGAAIGGDGRRVCDDRAGDQLGSGGGRESCCQICCQTGKNGGPARHSQEHGTARFELSGTPMGHAGARLSTCSTVFNTVARPASWSRWLRLPCTSATPI